VLGFAYLAWSVGALIGPFLAGLIYDLTQSYDLAFTLGGALLLAAAASVYLWGSHRGETGDPTREVTTPVLRP